MAVLTPEGEKYLVIGGVIAAVLFILVAVVLYFMGQDPTVVGGTGAAAIAAAAEAERRRRAEAAAVRRTQESTNRLGDDIRANRDNAKTDMAVVPGEVEKTTDEAKIDEGNNAFGPGE